MINTTTQLLVLMTTAPDRDRARQLAQTLVGEGLAACVNIVPSIESIYLWEAKIEQSSEVLLIIKVPEAGYEAVQQRLKTLHPYQVPELIALPVVKALPEYVQWAHQATRSPTRSNT
jgi:periplasmic divalent cation tolerance protein